MVLRELARGTKRELATMFQHSLPISTAGEPKAVSVVMPTSYHLWKARPLRPTIIATLVFLIISRRLTGRSSRLDKTDVIISNR